ncbi:cobW domain containing protein [Amanita muscaria]
MEPKSTPITVFTGFLGAGKTSVILSLLPRLPKDHKVVLLKNEFGDIKVDSKLAEQSTVTAVSEILNGCLCCVLVGQMETALLELKEKYDPDRIIIECSGSAFPATLAFQIRKLERETGGKLKLDGIITVIDAENFIGYEDTSPTAKMQASYTDLILINKWENVSDRSLDIVLDHLNTLNDLTPKIRCRGRDGVDPGIVFGLESTLHSGTVHVSDSHHDEVETITIYCDMPASATLVVTKAVLEKALGHLSKEVVWRVKGFVRIVEDEDGKVGVYIVNWAFGRYDLTCLTTGHSDEDVIKLTVMGERGEVKRASARFANALGAAIKV